jgi:hypothetical protein
MIAALLILLPVVGVVAWVFFRYTPAHAEREALFRFNIVALIVAAGLGAAWSLRTYLLMSPTVDSAWWPVISALGVLVVVPLVLGLAAILRHFVVFRPDEEGSRQ